MGQWTGYPDSAPMMVTEMRDVSISASVRNPDTTLLPVVARPSLTNPVKHVDHVKRAFVRYFDIPADAIERASKTVGEKM